MLCLLVEVVTLKRENAGGGGGGGGIYEEVGDEARRNST